MTKPSTTPPKGTSAADAARRAAILATRRKIERTIAAGAFRKLLQGGR